MSSPEQLSTPERPVEAPNATPEHYERAEQAIEQKEAAPESAEKQAERARVEALETAVSVEKGGAEKDRRPKSAAPARRRGAISKHEKKAAFHRQMKHIQAEMPAPQRAFSKFIHSPVIEKVSDTVGATVARPNAILAGSIAAFVLVLAVYLIARNYGYVLSGFETIAAFIVSWVIGTVYDYLRVMITGKKG